MKRWFLGLSVLLGSCGGGAPPLGPPHPATSPAEMRAASSSQAVLSQQVDFMSTPTAAAGQNISNLPVSASVAIATPQSTQPITVQEMTSFLNAPLPGCATVTPTSVTYHDCDF